MCGFASVIITKCGQSERRSSHEGRAVAVLQHGWPDGGISVSGGEAPTEMLLASDGDLFQAWRAHYAKVIS